MKWRDYSLNKIPAEETIHYVKSHLNFAIVFTETKAILSGLSQTGPGFQCVLYVKVVPSCIAECRQSETMVQLEIKVKSKFLALQPILSMSCGLGKFIQLLRKSMKKVVLKLVPGLGP